MNATIKAKIEKQKRIELLKTPGKKIYCRSIALKLGLSNRAATKQLKRWEADGIVRFTGNYFGKQKMYEWAERPAEAKQVRKRELKLQVDESNCRKLEFLARVRLFSVEDYVGDLIRREVQQHDWDKLND